MKQKRPITIALTTAIVLAIVCVIAFVIGPLRAAENNSRRIQVNFIFRGLSQEIEIYREEKGGYPHSLEDLKSVDYVDAVRKQGIEEVVELSQNNCWHDKYIYRPSTNGFAIIMTGSDVAPSGWFGKQRKIEKFYKIGDALK
jgi:hypothetical protein